MAEGSRDPDGGVARHRSRGSAPQESSPWRLPLVNSPRNSQISRYARVDFFLSPPLLASSSSPLFRLAARVGSLASLSRALSSRTRERTPAAFSLSSPVFLIPRRFLSAPPTTHRTLHHPRACTHVSSGAHAVAARRGGKRTRVRRPLPPWASRTRPPHETGLTTPKSIYLPG